jgi:hypothetical protein
VVAIGEGRSVQEVLDRASLPEFDGCRSLKGLVELGLAKVSQPPKRARSRKSTPATPKAVAEVIDEPFIDEPFGDEPIASEEAQPQIYPDEVTEVPAAETTVEEVASFEHAGVEPSLDPGEYVFSASLDEASEQPPEELAPWSVPLVEAAAGAEDEDYVPRPVPLPEPHHDEYANAKDPQDARAELEALIAEIPADEHQASTHSAAPDGLADRGPWTSRELDEMTEWGHEEQQQEATAASSFYDVEPEGSPVAPTRFHAYRAAGADEVESHDYTSDAAESVEDEVEEEETEPKPEPVNRGLLLKFLSSVRS